MFVIFEFLNPLEADFFYMVVVCEAGLQFLSPSLSSFLFLDRDSQLFQKHGLKVYAF